MTRDPPLGRDAYKAWREIGTRWSDNDAYGHVNNTVHYEWFDTAVNCWLIDRGLLDVSAGMIVGLVVATNCSYFAPLSYPQPVSVGLAVDRVGTSSVNYRLGIFAHDLAEPAAQGGFIHVYVDRATGRPVPLPDNWRRALAEIAA